MEATQVPINRPEGKRALVYTHNGILLGQRKNEILPFATAWMDQEGIMISEISQTEKDKDYMISPICRI